MPSFDIVSKVDMQDVDNAVNQAKKEIAQRYDFKGSKSSIALKEEAIIILGDDEYKLKAVIDILQSKAYKRAISLKSFDFGKVEDASGGIVRQTVAIRQGISKELGRKINKIIKNLKLKVQSQIQEDQVRVTGKKIDDLQAVIQTLKEEDLDIDLQFVNMRN
jgi:uncharacterized protein YajQ (UPF0234 family)